MYDLLTHQIETANHLDASHDHRHKVQRLLEPVASPEVAPGPFHPDQIPLDRPLFPQPIIFYCVCLPLFS